MELSIGREVGLIRLKNGRTLHPDVMTLHYNSTLSENVRQYKIVQRSLSHFFIQIEAEPGSESLVTDGFSTLIRNRIGEDVTMELEFVEHIPREESGKLRYFVAEVEI